MIASVARLAFRNLGRNKRRTALALASIMIAQFFVLTVDGFMAGYGDSMRDVMTGPLLGHVQIHAPGFNEKRSMDLVMDHTGEKLRALRSLPDVTSVLPRIYAPSLVAKTEAGFVAVVIGIDARAERERGGFLEELKDSRLVNALAAAVPREEPSDDVRAVPKKRALIGAALARRQDLQVGDELAVMGQRLDGAMAADLVEVAGIVPSTVDLINSSGVLIDLAGAQDIYGMQDQVHELTLRGTNAAGAEQLAARVEDLPSMSGTVVTPWQEGAPELVQMIGMMDSFTWVILAFVFVAAAAGIANTMVMSAFERVREMGVLLALGATPGRIVGMLVVETLLLGALGLLLGSVLGTAFNSWLGNVGVSMTQFASSDELADLSFNGINFNMMVYSRNRSEVLLQSLGAMAVTCFLAVLWPTRLVLRLEPTEAMRR
jgi:ABC-type lipoprotein release transport system permease subunit